jgi:precorrin-2 dehydrogenase/sirohydrochlorin ferrochelatase
MEGCDNVPFYPVNLHMEGRRCAVIGGGNVAERKVLSLLQAKAVVTIISPQITEKLQELARRGIVAYENRTYQPGDASGFFLLICAADDNRVNRRAAAEARATGALVNVVDAPELGSFTVPSQVSRGDLLFTVSTGGKSPALAKKLRRELEQKYGPEYEVYLELLTGIRDEIKNELPRAKDREAFWRQTIDQEILPLVRQGKIKEAEDKIRNAAACFRGKS